MASKSLIIIKRFSKDFLFPYRMKLSVAVISMIMVALTNAFQAWLLKPTFDEVFYSNTPSYAIFIPLLIAGITMTRAIATYLQNYNLKFVNQQIVLDIQTKLFGHLIYADLEVIEKLHSAKIISRFSNDVNFVKASVDKCIVNLSRELITIIFLIGVIFALHAGLALITFVALAILIFPIIRYGVKIRKISTSTQGELDNYFASLDQSFVAFKAIKAFNVEEREIKSASDIINRIFELYRKAIRIDARISPFVEMVTGLCIALTIYLGYVGIANGEITPGSFIAFIVVLITANKPIKSLSDFNNSLQQGVAAMQRIYDILDQQPKIISPVNPAPVNLNENSIIELKNISFDHENKEIFKNFNLKIEPGLITAIVGDSGAGKSTLLNLIARLFDVREGEVLIDNVNIRNISLIELRKKITYLSQEAFLFDKSIKDNITLSDEMALEQDVLDAAINADCLAFIEQLPKKMGQNIGPKGNKLSGGQKQRIALARAFFRNSPILLLDEATSAVDGISEQIIQSNLKKIRKNKTTIIVAHRLSSILTADQIILLRDGKFVDKGSHKELLKSNEYYQKLYSELAKENS